MCYCVSRELISGKRTESSTWGLAAVPFLHERGTAGSLIQSKSGMIVCDSVFDQRHLPPATGQRKP